MSTFFLSFSKCVFSRIPFTSLPFCRCDFKLWITLPLFSPSARPYPQSPSSTHWMALPALAIAGAALTFNQRGHGAARMVWRGEERRGEERRSAKNRWILLWGCQCQFTVNHPLATPLSPVHLTWPYICMRQGENNVCPLPRGFLVLSLSLSVFVWL